MEPHKRKWSVDAFSRNIHRINITLDKSGDEQRVLLQSDVHWDNPKCQQDVYYRHLDQARIFDAPVIDAGDFHCAMQGKWDKRANKNDLRPEHQTATYLDSLVSTAADALTPYQDLLTVRGLGNHETAILKRHETNLTERLVERLKSSGSKTVHMGGYSGFVVFSISIYGRIFSFKLYYHHGYGGGGPVTRGVIQTNRQAVFLADADFVLTGHTHDTWFMPIPRIRLSTDLKKIEHVRQDHLRGAGYKEEYADGFGGWHVERGGPPKPVGAWWLVFRAVCRKTSPAGKSASFIEYDTIEAK